MVIGSTHAFGPADLDLRPPPRQRGTMPFWLQECPRCNYVAFDISKTKGKARIRQVMESDAWKKLMPKSRVGHPVATVKDEVGELCDMFPGILARSKPRLLPNRFLRRALIEAELGEVAAAAHSTLSAAWAADDNRQGRAAASNRRVAASLFKQALNGKALDPHETTSTKLILIDVLRRADQWQESLSICHELEQQGLDEPNAAIVGFQKRLIEAHDNACYTVTQAAEGSSHPAASPPRD
jgi:hypothetical protein